MNSRHVITSSSESRVSSLLWSGLILTAPLNLFIQLSQNWAYVHGLLVDYFIPRWYLSDFWAVALALWYLWQWRRRSSVARGRWPHWWWWGLSAILLLNSFNSAIPAVSFWHSAKWLIWGWLATQLLVDPSQPWRSRWFRSTMWLVILGESLVAGYQWWQQQALFPYWVLGETNLRAFSGIVHSNLGGEVRVVPYGTAPHPNVLSGVVVGYAVLWTWIQRLTAHKTTWKSWLSLPVVLLTQSISGFGALVSGWLSLLCFEKTKILRPLLFLAALLCLSLPLGWRLLAHPQDSVTQPAWQYSISRRAWLNTAAVLEWQESPTLGQGLGTSPLAAELHQPRTEVVRFLQPPHHLVPLLLLEMGIVGMTWLLLGIILILKSQKPPERVRFLAITSWIWPILALDHYALSLQSGQILVMLTLALAVIGSRYAPQLLDT